MKVFPVYMNSLMKTTPLVGSTELSTDDRAHQRLSLMAMAVEDTQLLLYPRLIPLVGHHSFAQLREVNILLIEKKNVLLYLFFLSSTTWTRVSRLCRLRFAAQRSV